MAIILVLLELWAIRGVMKSGARSSSRLMWIAIIIFAPLLGMLAWLVAGPRQPSTHH
ncbi:MAG: PLDc_N domain-containing protein [Pseudomonas sp.]|nr:PLDc_N domain-containing protein [Pseudomonas sp.]